MCVCVRVCVCTCVCMCVCLVVCVWCRVRVHVCLRLGVLGDFIGVYVCLYYRLLRPVTVASLAHFP